MTGTTFFTKSGNSSTTLYLTYQVTSQSTANNTSTVVIRAYAKYTGGTKTSSSYSSGYFKLDGTTVASNGTYSISSGGEHLYGSITKTVTHDSNGKFPAVSVSWACKNYHFGTTSGTGTIASGSGATINRVSTISVNSSSYACGSTAAFTISRKNSAFKHSIYYQIDGGDWNFISENNDTSATWSIPTSLESSSMANTTSKTVTIWCETYTAAIGSGTYVGTTSTSFTITVRTSSVYSISSCTATEVASKMTSLNWGVFVKGYSQIKFSMAYNNNSNGASIKSIYWDFNYQSNSGTSTTWTTSTLQYGSDSGEAHTLTITITDSRGRKSSKTFSYTVYSITPPVINSFSVSRCTSDGTIDNSGTYAELLSTVTNASTANNKNSTSKSAYYKLNTASDWTLLSTVTSDSQIANITDGFDITKTYNIKLVVTDTIGNSVSKIVNLNSGDNFIQLRSDRKGLAIGKYSEKQGLEVGVDSYYYNRQIIIPSTDTYSDLNNITCYNADAENRRWSICNHINGNGLKLNLYNNNTINKYIQIDNGANLEVNGSVYSPVYKGGQSGTWTPKFGNSVGGSNASGHWYKIGNLVYVHGHIELSTASTVESRVLITGFPFTSVQKAFLGLTNCTFIPNSNYSGFFGIEVIENSKQASFVLLALGRVWESTKYSEMGVGFIDFSGTYLTNE